MPTALPAAFQHPYSFDPQFSKSVAYFSMEFAVDQALKTYSGGLGFLAGSHMKSAADLKQNVIGIGMLWKQGYYDQVRLPDNAMGVLFREKFYHFLQDTGQYFTINIFGRPVWVRAYYLAPTVFNTVPMFFLTTDVDGNDEQTRAISYRLYDSDPTMKVAQCMVLGLGGTKFLEEIGYVPDVYHFNEAHALSGAFHLYRQFGQSKEALRDRLVFTTHTPEEAGNEKHNIHFLNSLGFFNGLSLDEIGELTGIREDVFNHSLAMLRMARRANGVSKLHGEVSRQMWGHYPNICEITHVTNAQNYRYWADTELAEAHQKQNGDELMARKRAMKQPLLSVVADQAGKLFNPAVLTIVWARRFAAYKRPDLLLHDEARFVRLLNNPTYPVQIIWAGKPYPFDEGAKQIFNRLHYRSHLHPNMAVLTGYELGLSKLLKDGADVWLNTPVVPREASGTSGMTAAMNGAINLSTNDGWICEFAQTGNSFIVPEADLQATANVRDAHDGNGFYDLLEQQILPMYYDRPADWQQLMAQSMTDVLAYFSADRMAQEYYERVYA